MYIDINRSGIHLEFQEIAWLRVGGHQSLETTQNGLVEIWMPHIAPVYYQELQGIAASRELRPGNKTVDLHELSIYLHRQELHLEVILPDVMYALMQRGRTQIDLTRAGVDAHAKTVVDKRKTLKLPHDI